MTLQELYDIAGARFKLRLLAGKAGMDREISRLYYFEDLSISDWTRDGELLITTAMMTTRDPDWIFKFVKSVQSFHPCGILINTGGYLEYVPQKVIDYCESMDLPLFSFPWEIVLQDIMTEITNLVYVTEQRENNISQAFRNVIFNTEDPSGYTACFEKNGIDQYDCYAAVLCHMTGDDAKCRHFLRHIKGIWEKRAAVDLEEEFLFVFYGLPVDTLKNQLEIVYRNWRQLYHRERIEIYIGSEVDHYTKIRSSYQKARMCRKIGRKTENFMLAFQELGVLGVLAGSEQEILRQFCDQKLKVLREYDQNNDSDYTRTLEVYLFNHCNAGEVSEKMFIHRNTVNYRLRKISEITGEDLSDVDTLVNYRIAFLGELIL